MSRAGPYGDDYHGVDDYVPFLRRTLESLDGYVMRVDRVSAVGPDVVLAELSGDGDDRRRGLETPEALVFDLAPDGRIARVAIFLRRSFTTPDYCPLSSPPGTPRGRRAATAASAIVTVARSTLRMPARLAQASEAHRDQCATGMPVPSATPSTPESSSEAEAAPPDREVPTRARSGDR